MVGDSGATGLSVGLGGEEVSWVLIKLLWGFLVLILGWFCLCIRLPGSYWTVHFLQHFHAFLLVVGALFP